MVYLKQLAHDYGMSPFKARRLLRAVIDKDKHGRWVWEDDDPKLATARECLSNGAAFASSPKQSPEDDLPET